MAQMSIRSAAGKAKPDWASFVIDFYEDYGRLWAASFGDLVCGPPSMAKHIDGI